MAKKKLTRQEEFDIMKLVLDKFLWFGIAILGYGFFRLITTSASLWQDMMIMLGGAVLLVVLMVILVREFEFMK